MAVAAWRVGVAAWLCGGAVMAADAPIPPEYSAVPIPDGQVEAAVGAVDSIVAAMMAKTGVPGIAVAVVQGDDVLLAKGYGVLEAGRPEAVDADTVFQLASVSKSLSGTVVAHEVGAGRVAWETPVTTLLPWFALADPAATRMLTVGDLFAHRSGLPDHAGDLVEDLGYDRQAVLERLRVAPLAPFRATYAYTNFGLTAGAEAVAVAAGTDWATLSDRALFEPLGMARSSMRFADYMARENRARPHMRQGDGWAALEQRDPDPQAPAGGASSSVNDMARWLRLVLAGGSWEGAPLIDGAALLAATSPVSVSNPPPMAAARAGFYGYGFGVGETPAGRVMLSHSGAFELGAATVYQMLPSVGVGIVVLSNAQPIGAVEAIAFAFTDRVQFGRETRDWFETIQPIFVQMAAPTGAFAGQQPPADPAPARPLADYAGVYANDYYGPMEVTVEGDGLVARLGPKPVVFPLTHWSGDAFALTPRGENATAGSRAAVRFAVRDGAVATVTVDVWDEEGLGTFRR